MASYEQVIKFEEERPQGMIRLVESNGFYRAYNKSAYLFHQVIARHKVTKKFVKNINQEIVYVGFPVDKLLERIGGRSHKKTELGYDVELMPVELPDEAAYDEWRATVPTEIASRGDVNSLPASGDELYRAVCERIRVYPMETKSLIEPIRTFLRKRLKLELSENKTRICDARHGVEFLGAFIKPFRTYVSSRSFRRIRNHLHAVTPRMRSQRAQAVVNSSLGVLSHYDSYCVRKVLFEKSRLPEIGRVSKDGLRFYPNALDWRLYNLKGRKQCANKLH